VSDSDSDAIYDVQLQMAVGSEVIAFLEEHRDEIIQRALERIKRVRKEMVPETEDEETL